MPPPGEVVGGARRAGWFTEQGDPCGTLMQVQFALEDESRTKNERKRFKEREQVYLFEGDSE